MKYVVNIREHHSNRATCNEDRFLTESLVAHINQHQLEIHPGHVPELKLIYKCLCKRLPKIGRNIQNGGVDSAAISGADLDCNHDEIELDECAHDEWKMCRLHIVASSSQPIYSIRCPKCQLMLVHKEFKSLINEYGEHMKSHQESDNESFFLCPICGIVTK